MQKNAFIQQICDLSKNDKDLTNEFWENLFKFTIMGYIMIYIYMDTWDMGIKPTWYDTWVCLKMGTPKVNVH